MANKLEEGTRRIHQLVAQEILRRHEVCELLRLVQAGGAVPVPDGCDGGGDFWVTAELRKWIESDALHIRSAGAVADRLRVVDRGMVRSQSWDRMNRSFIAVIATENETIVRDIFTLEPIREKLLVAGAIVPDTFHLMVDHQKSVASIIGQGSLPRREGEELVADFKLADTKPAIDAGKLIEQDMLAGVSIGYRYSPDDAVDISPGKSATVAGRQFTNDDRGILRIVHKWHLVEASLVPFPADEGAHIRSATTERTNSMLAIHSRNSVTERATTRELTAALTMRCGLDDPMKRGYCEEEAERAYNLSEQPFHRLCMQAAERDGFTFAGRSESEICTGIYDGLQRDLSTANLSTFFNQAAVEISNTHFDTAGASWKGWVAEADNLDTKTKDILRLSGGRLALHPPGGEAEHFEISETGEQCRVHRYAMQLQIDEQDIRDGAAEDLFGQFPVMAGEGAAATRTDLLYAFILRNPTLLDSTPLFHADHANLNTSAALSIGTVTAATASIAAQQEKGVTLNLRGDYLIVPPALAQTAQVLARDLNVGDGVSLPAPVVKSDSRLEAGLTDPLTRAVLSGSATTWYMSTAGRHALEFRYLKGTNRRPQIRTGLFAKAGNWGMWLDVQFFLGICAVDHKGLVKNTA